VDARTLAAAAMPIQLSGQLPSQLPGTLGGALLLVCGVLALRFCWRRRPDAGPYIAGAGWLAILAGVVIFAKAWDGNGVLGTAYGMLAMSVVAYVVVAAGMEVRAARRPSASSKALEPEERRTNWLRGTAKAFLAIVLAGITAIGLGVAFALRMPLDTHDRIVVGGLLVPLLWGAGMAWTLCDARLVRATIVLVTASVFGYGVAFLPKVLG